MQLAPARGRKSPTTEGTGNMANGVFTLKHLTPDQEQMLKEAEDSLGGGVLLAYSDEQVRPTDLDESQIECLQGLEEKLGATIIAVRRE